MGKIIEFYGPPGSGKSTLVSICNSYLEKKGIEECNFYETKYLGFKKWINEKEYKKNPIEITLMKLILKLAPKLFGKRIVYKRIVHGTLFFFTPAKYEQYLFKQFLIRNFDFLKSILYKIDEMNLIEIFGSGFKEKILHRIERDVCKYQMAKELSNQKQIFVFSEAILKAILTPYSILPNDELPPNYEEDIKELIVFISSEIDYGFFVSADLETCNKRQIERGYHISEGIGRSMEEQERQEALERRITLNNLIHKTLLDNGVKSFKIKNNGTIEEAKKQLYPCLDEIIKDLEDTDD